MQVNIKQGLSYLCTEYFFLLTKNCHHVKYEEQNQSSNSSTSNQSAEMNQITACNFHAANQGVASPTPTIRNILSSSPCVLAKYKEYKTSFA